MSNLVAAPSSPGYTSEMLPKLTPELRLALAERPGQPIEVEDDLSGRVYLLVERDAARSQIDAWLISQLCVAEADVAAGRVSDWDSSRILSRLTGLEPPAE